MRSNEGEMTMRMRGKLLNQDPRGERKKERKEKHTPTHLARSGQTLKRQGKRKAEADGNGPRPADGGKGTEAPEPTYQSVTYACLGTRRPQTYLRRETTKQMK